MIERPFSYSNRDYASLLADLRRRMTIAIPEWTGFEAGFESILLELIAYNGDILNFYIDRMGSEAFLRTSVMRESVLNIAYMLGYLPAAQTAAACTIQFTKVPTLDENVVIPAGTQLFAQTEGQQPIYFETASTITILAADETGEVTGVEGLTIADELVGTSTGTERQTFVLHYPNVIRNSIHVYILNGPLDFDGNPTKVEWTKFDRLIEASFYEKAFAPVTDSQNYTYVVFGDGVSGQIPLVGPDVLVTYRYGVGSNGNVGAGAVRSFRNGGDPATKIASVTNTTSAVGGTDIETMQSMKTSIPKSMRTIERAVSIDDYANLAVRVPGVAKSNSVAGVGTNIVVYVAPTGAGAAPATLLNAVQAYFDGPPRRYLVGTTVTPQTVTYVTIHITLNITVNPRYRQDVVKQDVNDAVVARYAFDQRTIGELLSKGEVFHAVVDVPGVDYLEITGFYTGSPGTADIQLTSSQVASVTTTTITPTGGIVLS